MKEEEKSSEIGENPIWKKKNAFSMCALWLCTLVCTIAHTR